MTGKDLVAVNEQVQLKALKNYYERWEDKSERCEHFFLQSRADQNRDLCKRRLERCQRYRTPKSEEKRVEGKSQILSPFLPQHYIYFLGILIDSSPQVHPCLQPFVGSFLCRSVLGDWSLSRILCLIGHIEHKI